MPSSSSENERTFALMRSMTPEKSAPEPTGMVTGTALAPRRVRMACTVLSKSAPGRSILFTKASLGTPNCSDWRQTVSDWGSTPATAQKTPTAPSRTLRQRSTSMVKSTWPGVSIMLMTLSFQWQVVQAEVMVMPRSCSSGIKSIVAVPSWTSPMRWIFLV